MTGSNTNIIPASIHRPSHWQRLEESDADVAVDVDCCGDSGSASKLSSRSSGMSAYAGSKPLHRLSSRNACQPLQTLSEQHKSLPKPMGTSLTPAKQQQVRNTQILICVYCCLKTTVLLEDLIFAKLSLPWQDQSSSLPMAITPRMPKASSELSSTEASTEMAFRLNHARQTVAFVQRQVSRSSGQALQC